ncbi:hypothetical protein HMI54_012187, partial [Coelomomyces lativittatus]
MSLSLLIIDFFFETNPKSRPQSLHNCHFDGRVEGFEQSHVAISTCEGIHGFVIFNNIAKFSIHTLEDFQSLLLVSEHPLFDPAFMFYDTGRSIYSSLIHLASVPKPKLKSTPETNEINYANIFVTEKKGLTKHRYYDLTLVLSKTEPALNSIYAEHYIADIGNMLQLFYKFANFFGFNFRLLEIRYLHENDILSSTSVNFKSIDNLFSFSNMWNNESMNLNNSMEYQMHPK